MASTSEYGEAVHCDRNIVTAISSMTSVAAPSPNSEYEKSAAVGYPQGQKRAVSLLFVFAHSDPSQNKR